MTAGGRDATIQDGLAYYTARDNLAGDVRRGLVRPSIDGLHAALVERGGINTAVAAEWTERFLGDLARERATRTSRRKSARTDQKRSGAA